MAKVFYVTEKTADYITAHFFKTEKEALKYGKSQLTDFEMKDDMWGDDLHDEDNDTWFGGTWINTQSGILFSFEEGRAYIQSLDDEEARKYVKNEVGSDGAAMFFDKFRKGMYGYLGNGADGKGFKWEWDGDEINEHITPAGIGGMGPVVLPMDGGIGSGDVPAGKGDAEEEYKKKKKRMKYLKSFEAYSFDREGTEIKNPFTDETARQDVDPNSWYGKDYAKSDIKKIVDASEAFIAKYTEWKDMQPLDSDGDLHADYGQHVKVSLDELVKTVKKHG
tara:strand:+ start:1384 stop:2217 length:834 start_codon:yes stop_codon:yes gene_type:complete